MLPLDRGVEAVLRVGVRCPPVPVRAALRSASADGAEVVTEVTPEQWNAEHPVGTPVWFWPGGRQGPGRESVTRSGAWNLGTPTGTPVVMVDGYAGGIALSHVEPRPAGVTPYMHRLITEAADERERQVRAYVAEEIRRELVCCHIYKRGTAVEVEEARLTGHDLCYWGEASARIAEDRPVPDE